MARLLFVVALCLVLAGTAVQAQSDSPVSIFGYFQAYYADNLRVENWRNNNTFSLQQLNLFFQKDLGDNFGAFINFELTNAFSTQRNWGEFNIEEAFVRYAPEEYFTLKAGLLIPTFNNMNEIKNKTPLLPYIFRPVVYESSLSGNLTLSNYIPERANVQISGSLPIGAARFDYAVYYGNSNWQLTQKNDDASIPPGSDTTRSKLFGGRVGARYKGVKVGFSYSSDREPGRVYGPFSPLPIATVSIGNLPRTRIGIDASASFAGFTVEGEYIATTTDLGSTNEASLKALQAAGVTYAAFVGQLQALGSSWDRTFYYANLMYDFSDRWFAYAGYSYLDSKDSKVMADGFTATTAGGGYRANDNVVVKTQLVRYALRDNPFENADVTSLFLGVSVYF